MTRSSKADEHKDIGTVVIIGYHMYISLKYFCLSVTKYQLSNIFL